MKDQTIYDILHKEHETVQGILDKIDETDGGAARSKLLEQLKANLLPHMHAEEQVFYKPLRGGEDETRETALDATEEHRAARHVLQELERLSPDGELWKARFHVLKESIEHHVEEEEGEVFKTSKSEFSTEEAVEIGRQFLASKEEFIARQTPVKKAG
jgi:hypothetical protein